MAAIGNEAPDLLQTLSNRCLQCSAAPSSTVSPWLLACLPVHSLCHAMMLAATHSNLDKQKALQDVVKRTQATQAAAQQLHKQLSITQAETESILQLTSVMEAAQQKASHLAELLQSQDDAEHLAFSAVAQQAVELQLAAEQQQRAQLHAAAEQAAASRAAAEACEGSCTKEDAQAVLQQLQEMVDAAGVSLCSGSSSGRDSQCPDGAAPELGGACRTYADLVQRLSQLQADSYRMFVQCSIADWQQQQQVDEHQT